MKTIRFNVFETNSSSEHVVSIYNEEQVIDFKNFKEYYDVSQGMFVSVNDWKNSLKEFTDVDKIKEEAKKYHWETSTTEEAIKDAEAMQSITDEQVEIAFNWLMNYLKESNSNGDNIQNEIESLEKDDFGEDFTDSMITFMNYIFEDSWKCWTWDSWGYGYEEGEIEEFTTAKHGDKVVVMSYSGYPD